MIRHVKSILGMIDNKVRRMCMHRRWSLTKWEVPIIKPLGFLCTLPSYHLLASLLHTREAGSFSSLHIPLFCFYKKEPALVLWDGERQKEVPE